MDDSLVSVAVRIPRPIADRVKRLAGEQDRTIQAVYTRAIRLGLDLEEEHHRIACEAIKAAERRRAARAHQAGGGGEG